MTRTVSLSRSRSSSALISPWNSGWRKPSTNSWTGPIAIAVLLVELSLPRCLLSCHRHADALVGVDEVVRVFCVLADVDLDPVHLAGEGVRDRIVVCHECAVLDPDVAGVVGREEHRRRACHLPLADGGAVEVEHDGAALAH